MGHVAEAIARLKTAQTAYDAVKADDDLSDAAFDLSEAESEACNELVEAPCANDAEFIEKLRCLIKRETRIYGSAFRSNANFVSVARAAAVYFEENGEEKMLEA